MERTTGEWSIQEVARLAGTTSRTLRHYGDVGLVQPSRVGANGYRYYDADALVRLQRVLLLRELGLGIAGVAEVLAGQTDDAHALGDHLRWLHDEQARIGRQIASVERTIRGMEGGEQIMAETMFDGFDHTQYEAEVTERWGAEAYAKSDAWWRGLSADERAAWKARVALLQSDWIEAWESGATPDSGVAQALAQRQYDWLSGMPGTPQTADGRPTKAYFMGLGDMYVADPRFGRHYGGVEGATFVRDAMHAFAQANL
ncbi:TipAS antibiotic-recognition domain-containing protein [Pseudolysinimonas kribbensis]|uniref:MerR family transcriptional regulator n=1 Tax=Pseudolysinimonas kribbensis TaxID=433641 RepID=A0ABQ6K923_9MICO|nr:TipAS antibiotic-recognition domain-containing protein [Pseudolysinimonas kribbensis]GMA95327.1 MerR family transcriptional regulator [Pseudolysinimonas kribbensis]